MENQLRRSMRITQREPVIYTGFFSIADDEDHSEMWYSADEEMWYNEPEEPEDDDVIIGVTVTDRKPVPTCVTTDNDICNFCLDTVKRERIYYISECNHLYCGDCIKIAQLNECTRCTQPLLKAHPTNIVYPKMEDE